MMGKHNRAQNTSLGSPKCQYLVRNDEKINPDKQNELDTSKKVARSQSKYGSATSSKRGTLNNDIEGDIHIKRAIPTPDLAKMPVRETLKTIEEIFI